MSGKNDRRKYQKLEDAGNGHLEAEDNQIEEIGSQVLSSLAIALFLCSHPLSRLLSLFRVLV